MIIKSIIRYKKIEKSDTFLLKMSENIFII
jgi:hypothetical protein